MTEYMNLLLYNCLNLFENNNIDYNMSERKEMAEAEISYLSFNVTVTMHTICMLLGKDPLAFRLLGNLMIPETSIEISLTDDYVVIQSDGFRLPRGKKGIFDLFDIVNNHNIESLHNKAYITPDGTVRLSSEYNIQTYHYYQRENIKYDINYISELIFSLAIKMILDIYDIYLENEKLINSFK